MNRSRQQSPVLDRTMFLSLALRARSVVRRGALNRGPAALLLGLLLLCGGAQADRPMSHSGMAGAAQNTPASLSADAPPASSVVYPTHSAVAKGGMAKDGAAKQTAVAQFVPSPALAPPAGAPSAASASAPPPLPLSPSRYSLKPPDVPPDVRQSQDRPQAQAAPLTLLDEVGRLRQPVPAAEVAGWKREIKTTHPAADRAAHLHIWLGEWELANNEQPVQARWHFRQARLLTKPGNTLYNLAAYDSALGLAFAGAYQEASEAFQSLLKAKTSNHGYSHIHCAFWLRHVGVCAQYHEAHAKLGIPEPTRLDPLCGAAALAACLKPLALPYDRATLLKACRVTGEGSTLQDVLDAGRKLGVDAQAVTTDDAGLRLLPKPLVAYVEHDHFIAVVRADTRGVSYLCSDCGPWPGGRVDLTWAQWHSLEPGLFAVVTPRAGTWSQALAGLSPGAKVARNSSDGGIKVASVGRLVSLPPARVASLVPAMPILKRHVVLIRAPVKGVKCGSSPVTSHPTPDQCDASMDDGTKGDPVDLATGEEDYTPDPDITVYNPNGPSVVWQRLYESLRGPGRNYVNGSSPNDSSLDPTYQSDDFGVGWSQSYNLGVIDNVQYYTSGTRTILFPNGSTADFSCPTAPTASKPSVICYALRSGFPMVLQWNYTPSYSGGQFTIIMKDRTQWVTTTGPAAPGNVCMLSRIIDRTGNSVTFFYSGTSTSAASYGWPLLSGIGTYLPGPGGVAIRKDLLTINRATDGSGNITSVKDCYSRSVYYRSTNLPNSHIPAGWPQNYYELTDVSQIVPTNSASPPDRLFYGYRSVPNGETNNLGVEQVSYLSSIGIPNPTGYPTPSTSYIWYANDPNAPYLIANSNVGVPFVGGLQDSNNNFRVYSSVDVNGNYAYPSGYTKVSVENSSGAVFYSYVAGFDTNMNETSRTGGSNTRTFYDSVNTYQPALVIGGNGIPPAAAQGYYPPGGYAQAPFNTVNSAPGSSAGYGSQGPLNAGQWAVSVNGAIVADNQSSNDLNGWNVTPSNMAVNISSYAPPGATVTAVYQNHIGIPPSPQGGPYDPSVASVTTFHILGPNSPVSNDATHYTWDQYGNMTSETSARGTKTSYFYSPATAIAPFGELTSVQEGSKSPTSFTYYEPSGLVNTVTSPLPNTTGSSQVATTTYVYDLDGSGYGLGNLTSVTTPGNSAVGSMTTKFDYGTSPAIGQPLTVTDNLLHASHYTYDLQGNVTSFTDATGIETDYGDSNRQNGYNNANQAFARHAARDRGEWAGIRSCPHGHDLPLPRRTAVDPDQLR